MFRRKLSCLKLSLGYFYFKDTFYCCVSTIGANPSTTVCGSMEIVTPEGPKSEALRAEGVVF